MTTIKRLFGAILLILGMTIILLGVASAAVIIVIIACPFFALGLGVEFWEETKPKYKFDWSTVV